LREKKKNRSIVFVRHEHIIYVMLSCSARIRSCYSVSKLFGGIVQIECDFPDGVINWHCDWRDRDVVHRRRGDEMTRNTRVPYPLLYVAYLHTHVVFLYARVRACAIIWPTRRRGRSSVADNACLSAHCWFFFFFTTA